MFPLQQMLELEHILGFGFEGLAWLTAFGLGVSLGGGVGWILAFRWRREAMRLDEERQILEQERQIVLGFMHNFVEAVGEGVDRQELFRRVVHSSVVSTGALSACVFVREGEQLAAAAIEGLFPPQRPLSQSRSFKVMTRSRFIESVLRSERVPVGEGVVGAVASSGSGELIADATRDPRIVQHEDPVLRTRSLIVVPIHFRDKLLAVLAIANPADGTAFTESDFSLAESIAEQSALAIHNLDLMAAQIEKNKMDVDLALASNIQGMLLPKAFPDNPALDIGALYLPAQKVGGDLYDVFQLDDDRVGVAIADVSGKGVPASLLMAICQSNLRHLARSHPSPAETLSALNNVMRGEMRRDMFVTMIYAIIDSRQNQLTLARAGHELPILFHRENDGMSHSSLIESDGIALGMANERMFRNIVQDRTIDFTPGDVFVLYTDGITEATNGNGTEFSVGRLADVVKELRGMSAHALNEGVLERVAHFSSGVGQSDDITLVTVRHL